jgi:hypothetical protein
VRACACSCFACVSMFVSPTVYFDCVPSATGATIPPGRLRARSWVHDACCCLPTHHGEHGAAHVRFASIASSTSSRSDSAIARLFPGGRLPSGRDATGTAGRRNWGAIALTARDYDGAGQVDEALKTVNALIAKRKGSQTKFELVPKDEKMEQAIQILKAYNPTPDPGKWDSLDKTSRYLFPASLMGSGKNIHDTCIHTHTHTHTCIHTRTVWLMGSGKFCTRRTCTCCKRRL